MENLLLPSKVEFLPGTTINSGSFVIAPCHHGYGTTLGNTIRRVLLSSLPGAAVEAFKIKGVQHEFGAVEGIKEDVVQIILNLKQLALKVYSDEPVVLTISKKGPGAIKAGDIEKNANVEVINNDLTLATLTSNKNFEMEIVAGRGRGYKPVEEKDKQQYDLGTIAVDSVYNPIKDVGYSVEYTRVGEITNYEKLTLNVETNGSISPKDAVGQALKIIMDHFSIVIDGVNESREEKTFEITESVGDQQVEEPAEKEEKVEKKEKIKRVGRKKGK